MQVTDEQIKELLTKLNAKYRRYRSRQNKTEFEKTIYEQTGLFKNGRIVDVKTFHEKFKGKEEHGIHMIEEKLQRNYIRNVNKRFKDNMVTMLENMGLHADAKDVEEMSYNEFVKVIDDYKWVAERYNAVDDVIRTEQISGIKTEEVGTIARKVDMLLNYTPEERKHLSKEERDFLGY